MEYLSECQNVFALICRSHYETKERLYSFEITSEDVDKVAFLKTLCRLMANITCRADAVNTYNKVCTNSLINNFFTFFTGKLPGLHGSSSAWYRYRWLSFGHSKKSRQVSHTSWKKNYLSKLLKYVSEFAFLGLHQRLVWPLIERLVLAKHRTVWKEQWVQLWVHWGRQTPLTSAILLLLVPWWTAERWAWQLVVPTWR